MDTTTTALPTASELTDLARSIATSTDTLPNTCAYAMSRAKAVFYTYGYTDEAFGILRGIAAKMTPYSGRYRADSGEAVIGDLITEIRQQNAGGYDDCPGGVRRSDLLALLAGLEDTGYDTVRYGWVASWRGEGTLTFANGRTLHLRGRRPDGDAQVVWRRGGVEVTVLPLPTQHRRIGYGGRKRNGPEA